MKILTPGHKYQLDYFEPIAERFDSTTGIAGVALSLCHKIEELPCGDLQTEISIAASELQSPCRENALAATKLDEALMWLEKRTADRKARGVEGTREK